MITPEAGFVYSLQFFLRKAPLRVERTVYSLLMITLED